MDDLYEEYKATVEEQRLTFEQSMLCDYLVKSLPNEYYLPLRQTFRGKSSKDKEWLEVINAAREVHDDQVELIKAKKKTGNRPGTSKSPQTPSPSTAKKNRRVERRREISYEAEEEEEANLAKPTQRKYQYDGNCGKCGKYGHKT